MEEPMLRKIATIVLVAISVVVSSFAATPPFRARRPLRVLMYPFVPDKVSLFDQIKRDFEATYPEVELQIIDIGDNYYDEGSPHAITNTDADIFELDSV